MPTNATRLSNRQLKAVKATGKDFVLSDGDGAIPGCYRLTVSVKHHNEQADGTFNSPLAEYARRTFVKPTAPAHPNITMLTFHLTDGYLYKDRGALKSRLGAKGR